MNTIVRIAATVTVALGAVLAPRVVVAQTSADELQRRIDTLEREVAALKVLIQQRTAVDQAAPPRPLQAPDSAPRAGSDQETTFLDYLHDLKVGAVLDTYYDYNFNHPIGRVNLLRAYDVTSNNFSLNQAALVAESAPDLANGRRFGARVDLQYGQATETLQGSLANEPRPWVYRNVFQAYGTYVAPIGSGLTINFGKWSSALGYENNYTKDQINYSRSYWFNFLPFYHMGARVNYRLSDGIALNYWITNGTQQTEAFNNFKDQFAGVVLQPAKSVSWTINYYLGQEHPDVQTVQSPSTPILPTQSGLSIVPVVPYYSGKLHILDSYATWHASSDTTLAVEADYVVNHSSAAVAASKVAGGAAYLQRQLTGTSTVAARAEYLIDDRGLFSGVSQRLKEATFTYDYLVSEGFLVRSEWRHDFSSRRFFLTNSPGVLKASQDTATLGVIWWWGTKRGAW